MRNPLDSLGCIVVVTGRVTLDEIYARIPVLGKKSPVISERGLVDEYHVRN
jgi:hypothetical protein